MECLRNSIYVETEYLGCNPSFVVTSQGIVLIDTPGQKPFEALEWKKEIAKHGDVVYVFNTDHHIDHCVGNYFFNGESILHEGTWKKLCAADRTDALLAFEKLIGPPAQLLVDILERGLYAVKQPKITYQDRVTIYLGEEIFELIPMKGHTEFETLVYMPRSKVLFTGDNVCTCGIPNLSEACLREWLDTLQWMESLDVDILVPGHGKIGNQNSIREFRVGLESLIEGVREKKRQGMSRDDVVREVSYPDHVHVKYPPAFSERFSNHVKNGIRRIYEALDGSLHG